MKKFETLKKRLGYLPAVGSGMATLVALLAPQHTGNSEADFWLMAIRHSIPECLVVSAACILFFFLLNSPESYLRKVAQTWRSTFDATALTGARTKLAAYLPGVLLGFALLISLHPIHQYARARYAYWVKGGIEKDFEVEQIRRAYQYEAVYDFDRAIRKYEEISERYPHSGNSGHLKERAALNKGIRAYANSMFELAKDAESRQGFSRQALELYLEALRVMPRHAESRKRIAAYRQEIAKRIGTVTPLVNECSSAPSGMPAKLTELHFPIMEFLLDWPSAAQARGGAEPPPSALCAVVQRFPGTDDFLELVRSSWQMERMNAIMKFSDDVLGGKNMTDLLGPEKSRIIELSVPIPHDAGFQGPPIPFIPPPLPAQ